MNGLQSCLASLQSWMSTCKLKLSPDETKFSLIRNEWKQSKYLSMFPIDHEIFGVKTNPAKSAWNLGVIFAKNSPLAHIYQESVAHAFTICAIYGAFAVTSIWIVQNYRQLLLCPVLSIIAIHFCMVSPTVASQGVFRINWCYLLSVEL